MNSPNQRIEVSGSGVGEISDADVENRARELATGDGRTEPNEVDFDHARRELHVPAEDSGETPEPGDGIAAETDLDPPGTTGHKTANQFLENEDHNDSADLVREGLDEADHDTRTKSGHPEGS